MLIQLFSFFFIMFLLLMFFLGSKNSVWEMYSKSIFECGYSSYFFSRFSFSIQYFLVALTFLLLDLELCFLMPYFNEESASMKVSIFFFSFTLILTFAMLIEWKKKMLDWKS